VVGTGRGGVVVAAGVCCVQFVSCLSFLVRVMFVGASSVSGLWVGVVPAVLVFMGLLDCVWCGARWGMLVVVCCHVSVVSGWSVRWSEG
jgi:hypothetical protein